MNIDDYKRVVAEESKKADDPAASADVETEAKPIVEPIVEPVVEPSEVGKIKIDDTEFTLDEVKEWRKGNMRTQDYTKKTQAVAKQRKENEEAIELLTYLRANPQIAQAMLDKDGADSSSLSTVNPDSEKVKKLESDLYDMRVEREIETLQRKYPDFEVVDVLNTAQEKGFASLEDAYLYTRGARQDAAPAAKVDAITEREKIKAEIMKELSEKSVDTSTIVSDSSLPVTPIKPTITLSAQEDAVRKKMGLSTEEWLKWRQK